MNFHGNKLPQGINESQEIIFDNLSNDSKDHYNAVMKIDDYLDYLV